MNEKRKVIGTTEPFPSFVPAPQPAPASVLPPSNGKVSEVGATYDRTGRVPEPALTERQVTYLGRLRQKREQKIVDFSDTALSELECILKGVLHYFEISTPGERKVFRIEASLANLKLPADKPEELPRD